MVNIALLMQASAIRACLGDAIASAATCRDDDPNDTATRDSDNFNRMPMF
jgi:hypothetical protein